MWYIVLLIEYCLSNKTSKGQYQTMKWSDLKGIYVAFGLNNSNFQECDVWEYEF